ncbi:MAG: transporter ATP-binding protein [Caulobacteraceae bacterium]|nr:transporter ATP-binding protein [Caulobacteraceae bacterium]
MKALAPSDPVFTTDDLRVSFQTPDGQIEAVRGVTLRVMPGECLGVVGESGSGKSQTFLAALGLLARNGRATGSVRFEGRELLGLSQHDLNKVRGAGVSMIFQDPLTALTPHMRIGEQIAEPMRRHLGVSAAEARLRAKDWLDKVRVPDATRRLRQFPHELSGGMRQRVMIAAALCCGPRLLIADEPTTALDVTVQAEILDLMSELMAGSDAALVLITHDMGVIARLADRVAVMRSGMVVEEQPVGPLFAAPQTEYAAELLAAIPRLDRADRGGRPMPAPVAADAPVVVRGEDIQVAFAVRNGLLGKPLQLAAVDGVSFDLRRGETLGVVGESGCGKSTLARAVLRLLPASAKLGGSVSVLGRDLTAADEREMRGARKDLQIVFQDPLASLDPRAPVGESVAEPLRTFRPDLSRSDRQAAAAAMMARCGLDPALFNRYPHELSGGQNQRVGIARAMVLEPRIVICDEAVSALDVSVRAQVIDLLIDLQRELGLSMIFISHDLAVVREVSHRVMVLYLGRIMELADRAAIWSDARHPYTQALMSAAPIPDPVRERGRIRLRLDGEPGSALDPQAVLRFLPSKLGAEPPYRPRLTEVAPGHLVSEFDPV